MKNVVSYGILIIIFIVIGINIFTPIGLFVNITSEDKIILVYIILGIVFCVLGGIAGKILKEKNKIMDIVIGAVAIIMILIEIFSLISFNRKSKEMTDFTLEIINEINNVKSYTELNKLYINKIDQKKSLEEVSQEVNKMCLFKMPKIMEMATKGIIGESIKSYATNQVMYNANKNHFKSSESIFEMQERELIKNLKIISNIIILINLILEIFMIITYTITRKKNKIKNKKKGN